MKTDERAPFAHPMFSRSEMEVLMELYSWAVLVLALTWVRGAGMHFVVTIGLLSILGPSCFVSFLLSSSFAVSAFLRCLSSPLFVSVFVFLFLSFCICLSISLRLPFRLSVRPSDCLSACLPPPPPPPPPLSLSLT